MPELPEVETVRRGLAPLLVGRRIKSAKVFEPRLRGGVRKDFAKRVVGARIVEVARRAKYLLIRTDGPTIVSHLGMTGTWRVRRSPELGLHEHAYLQLDSGDYLIYHDPRRFGLLDVVARAREQHDPRLRDLGPEPLDTAAFTVTYLVAACAGRRAPVKAALMDQQVVVGVGNIYAAEALFRAGIAPKRPARRVSADRLARLIVAVREVLGEAIDAGGSSIDDFRKVSGEGGYFQHAHRVYGRGGEPCLVCGTKLQQAAIGGRTTVWCKVCQT